MTPKIGLSGQFVKNVGNSGDGATPGVITAVNGDGTVDARQVFGSLTIDNGTFVDVGGTPPAAASGNYFQAIDAAS